MIRALSSLALLALLSGGTPEDRSSVLPNDNRIPAGRLSGDTLQLRLVVDLAAWRPEADSGPEIQVEAFAEEGKPPQVPGPLIRVREGTVISATIRNALADSTLRIYGLVTRPAAVHDSLVIPPGQTRTVIFPAGVPGSYMYWASLGHNTHERDAEREQLAGAFVVDPVGGSPPDRILVLNIWGTRLSPERYRAALAINGRSWPHTERIQATVGDTLRWRVINATWRNHPMHLHGFYYRVDARGDGFADTVYAPADRRLVVTEGMRILQTMGMTWVPARAGNWLFHCHIAFHVIPRVRLDPPAPDSDHGMAHDAGSHMAGLVVGIAVRPRADTPEEVRSKARRLHLFVQEGAKRGRAPRALGFVLQRNGSPPAADSVEIPGSVLVLTRGQPTDVVVVNRLKEPTAIHWHGIELESYSDGVVGWSGDTGRLAPSVMPGDSFTARLTLPRSGTFMYHTHLNDADQITSGLYGAIVVLEPGQRYNPRRDHVFVTGWDGETRAPTPFHLIVNGDSTPGPYRLAAGVAHRFRFINIGPAGLIRYSILRDSSLVTWRRLAKDGANLPPHQAVVRPSAEAMAVGETYDFEFKPEPGTYRLVIDVRDQVRWSRELVAR